MINDSESIGERGFANSSSFGIDAYCPVYLGSQIAFKEGSDS